MKMKIVIILLIVITILLVMCVGYILRIDKEKSCYEAAYWKSYDDTATPKVDESLYTEYSTKCMDRK